jgi:hypothetical protein
MSGVEPGPKGTMSLTVFVGQSCAEATAGESKSADNTKATLLFIAFSRSVCFVSSSARLSPREQELVRSNHGQCSIASIEFGNRSGDRNGETP